MSHEHQRREDDDAQPKVDVIDALYKGGKIAAMLVIGGGFILSIRDKIEAVPVLQKDVNELKQKSSEQERMLSYLVGGMEQMTGKKYRGRRNGGGE